MPENPLLTLIKDRIEKNGPMTVAEYMALALAHPEYGYYMRKDPLGVSGDFTTAPEISQVFGELIGAWLATQWLAMGKPRAALAELGPGRGTLMNDILRATKHVSGFHDSIDIHLVETSPVLKQKQWQALVKNHANITWHDDFSALPDMPLLLVANEFFDALPIRQFVDGEERMIFLPLEGGGLRWGSIPCIEDRPPPCPPPSRGRVYETCKPAQTIMHEIAERIATHNGAALIIDYGYEQGSGDTLQAVREHAYCDVLADPGMADLTAHVDFSALKNAATGCAVYGPVPQGAFLTRLGVAERTERLAHHATDAQVKELYSGVRRLTNPAQMGELFKVLCVANKDLAKPEGF